ncbi:MAG: O-antigen ligase family protein [Tannerella sp.]|jgi:O-antigen ligase|nr:O-antigen ligase family protein [Tannerella sp.]
MSHKIKYGVWITRVLIIAGLGCSVVYSTQLFDGVKTAKTFYFIVVICQMLFFMSIRTLGTKKNMIISLSMPDILLLLYALWAFFRLMTSDTDSFHNPYFWEFSACILWYFCLRSSFVRTLVRNIPTDSTCDDTLKRGATPSKQAKSILFVFIGLGYVQLIFCALQLSGWVSSFSPIFPISGTFDNTSELCIFLTCILPIAVHAGLKASDTTPVGKLVRAACLIYVLCWLALVLAMTSRTALLSGFIGIGVFAGLQTGFLGHLKRKTHTIVIPVVLSLMIGGFVFLLAQYKNDSASGRLLIWKVAWSGIKDAPVQGQGFNAFQARYGHYQAAYFQQHAGNEKEIMIADNMTVAMNDYVETAFNLGFIGLLLLVAFWLSLFGKIAGQARSEASNGTKVVAVTVLVIFLVGSGFYFLEKMLPVKVIALFFAAQLGSSCKSIVNVCIRPILMKSIAAMLMIFSCFTGYATGNKTKHYADWNQANMLAQFGYLEEAKAKYELVYPHLRHNGLFLFFDARNLYENKAYLQCLEYMEAAKPQRTGDRFLVLLGDAFHHTGDDKNAIIQYEYASYMVPNRFRPLYKLFKLYEETDNTHYALEIAQRIVNKRIKVDSYEVRGIKRECNDFIHLKEHEEQNK